MIQNNDWVAASELSVREFNSLRGKICSAIEAIGLPHQQERAVIAQIKQYSYDSQETVAQLLSKAAPDKRFKYDDNRVEAKND
jgi:hypothetical protein